MKEKERERDKERKREEDRCVTGRAKKERDQIKRKTEKERQRDLVSVLEDTRKQTKPTKTETIETRMIAFYLNIFLAEVERCGHDQPNKTEVCACQSQWSSEEKLCACLICHFLFNPSVCRPGWEEELAGDQVVPAEVVWTSLGILV